MAAPPAGHHTAKIARFDTKIESMRYAPGSAARGAAKAARHHGYESAAKAESSYVPTRCGQRFGHCSWAFVLRRLPDGRTRLISRTRYRVLSVVSRHCSGLLPGFRPHLQPLMLRG